MLSRSARIARTALLATAAWLTGAAAHAGEMTLYSNENFTGREVTLRDVTPDLVDLGFNDRASSMVIRSGRWEVCVDSEFRGNCQIFERGEYRNLHRMNDKISSAREVGTGRDRGAWRHYGAKRGIIELFSSTGAGGNSTRVVRDTNDFVQIGFNDRAQSMVVEEGTWQLCVDADYRGFCRVFQPGRYTDLGPLTGRVSSARRVNEDEMRNPPPRVDPDTPVVLFSEEGLRGRSVALRAETPDLVAIGFNDAASSMVIQSGTWEFCVDSYFRGGCRVLGPGQYRALDSMLVRSISSARMMAPPGGPGRAEGEVELFSGQDFSGARLPLRHEARTLADFDFNDRAGSIIVHSGQWQFCVHADFGGQCVIYGPGRYGRLGSMSNQISSLRRFQ
jgi:hypothetical protein